jgi:catechol 2,3-dioxygenase-like lactoylglutathione lyase family enzyme
MIGYVTIGTNDLERAKTFYDALLGEVGGKRVMDLGKFVLWAGSAPSGMIAVTTPYNDEAATASNGGMTALEAKDKAQVDRLHALALSLGGTCEGPPGQRSDNFYAAYFRDLDGNKLAAFHMG